MWLCVIVQYYLIKSKLNGLVLDVKKGGNDAGAHVITYTHHGKDNQLWYDDVATGTIRSKQTGFCLDLNGKPFCLYFKSLTVVEQEIYILIHICSVEIQIGSLIF